MSAGRAALVDDDAAILEAVREDIAHEAEDLGRAYRDPETEAATLEALAGLRRLAHLLTS